MTEINGASGVRFGNVDGFSVDAHLDAETILLYCSTQLNDLNGEIKVRLSAQQSMRAQKKILAELQSLLNKYVEAGVSEDAVAQKREILEQFGAALNQMPPGAAREAVMAVFNDIRSSACHKNGPPPFQPMETYATKGIAEDLAGAKGKGNDLAPQEIKNLGQRLQNASDDLGKDSELQMIGLQQLISQRQMAIQMTTNMMNKYSQGLEAIVGNIGR